MTDKLVTTNDLTMKMIAVLDQHADIGVHEHLIAAIQVVAMIVDSIDCKDCRAVAAYGVKNTLSDVLKEAVEHPSSENNHIH